jgi:hypothetical protein
VLAVGEEKRTRFKALLRLFGWPTRDARTTNTKQNASTTTRKTYLYKCRRLRLLPCLPDDAEELPEGFLIRFFLLVWVFLVLDFSLDFFIFFIAH